MIRPEGRELEDVISQRAVLQGDCRGHRRRASRGPPGRRPASARRARSGPAACAPSSCGRTRCCCCWRSPSWPPSGPCAAAPATAERSAAPAATALDGTRSRPPRLAAMAGAETFVARDGREEPGFLPAAAGGLRPDRREGRLLARRPAAPGDEERHRVHRGLGDVAGGERLPGREAGPGRPLRRRRPPLRPAGANAWRRWASTRPASTPASAATPSCSPSSARCRRSRNRPPPARSP